MSIFLDTNFFIALLNTRDNNHKLAKNLLKKLQDTRYGNRYVSDYVLDEVITGLWKFTKNKNLIIKAYDLIVNNPEFVIFTKISPENIETAWEKWQKYAEYPKCPLSFTDATIIALIEKMGINNLLTFDKEFEGLAKIME